MATLTTLCLVCIVALTAYIICFAVIGFVIARSNSVIEGPGGTSETSFLIIVPAHNEAEHLRPTLRSLRHLDYPPHLFHVTVIADNCSDGTASIACEERCDVRERVDSLRRGKGYALDWALAELPVSKYGAVVVIDADTICSPNLLQVFAREMRIESVPVQARVAFEFPGYSPGWLSSTSRATQRAEEMYVSVPRSHLRLYQGLQGTGFCIPSSVLQVVPWSAHSICEDLEYGFQLAFKGMAPRFVQDAFVTSSMTGRVEYASDQRERWARGTYSLIAKLIPLQIFHAIMKGDWKSLESCFYLATRSRLPLAVLTLISGVGLLICRHQASVALWILFAFALTLQAVYVFAIVSALRPEYGRRKLFLGFMRYAIWILHQHVGAMFSLHSNRWTRTERG